MLFECEYEMRKAANLTMSRASEMNFAAEIDVFFRTTATIVDSVYGYSYRFPSIAHAITAVTAYVFLRIQSRLPLNIGWMSRIVSDSAKPCYVVCIGSTSACTLFT